MEHIESTLVLKKHLQQPSSSLQHLVKPVLKSYFETALRGLRRCALFVGIALVLSVPNIVSDEFLNFLLLFISKVFLFDGVCTECFHQSCYVLDQDVISGDHYLLLTICWSRLRATGRCIGACITSSSWGLIVVLMSILARNIRAQGWRVLCVGLFILSPLNWRSFLLEPCFFTSLVVRRGTWRRLDLFGISKGWRVLVWWVIKVACVGLIVVGSRSHFGGTWLLFFLILSWMSLGRVLWSFIVIWVVERLSGLLVATIDRCQLLTFLLRFLLLKHLFIVIVTLFLGKSFNIIF